MLADPSSGRYFLDLPKTLMQGKTYILVAVLWTIWNQRKVCIFENANPNCVEVQELIKPRVAFWVGKKRRVGMITPWMTLSSGLGVFWPNTTLG